MMPHKVGTIGPDKILNELEEKHGITYLYSLKTTRLVVASSFLQVSSFLLYHERAANKINMLKDIFAFPT